MENKWFSQRDTRAPARVQTDLRNEEIRKQVDQMLADGRIRVSTASSWSQVHLVPKPDNQWRFCIDFRWLNLFTTCSEG